MSKRIYLDYAAGTPIDPGVFKAMKPYFSEKYGNPGSLHAFGQEAIAAVDHAREIVAKNIGADFRQIVFTGSATEANGLALHGASIAAMHHATNKSERRRIIVSAIEHESVLESAHAAERAGLELIVLPVDKEGFVDPSTLRENLNDRTVVVSVVYANNEIGTVQPIRAMAEIIKAFRGKNKYPLFHTDAAQALQFLNCNVQDLGVDLMTLSGQKIYGPKGVGVLFVRDLRDIAPIIEGGGQEFGLRSGTENVPAIVGFAKALERIAETRQANNKKIADLRQELWHGIKKIFDKAEINGVKITDGEPAAGEHDVRALPNILNIYFPGPEAQDVLTKFDLNGLAAAAGSACHSRALEPSYVLKALGHSPERVKSSIRFSLGRPTTSEEITAALGVIRETFSVKIS